MRFGKFKGERIDQLPNDYLEWLLQIDLREPLASQVRAEHERRVFSQEAAACVNPAVVDELVGAGLRQLSLKYHPDRGGSHERMVQVNAAAEWLRSQVRAIA